MKKLRKFLIAIKKVTCLIICISMLGTTGFFNPLQVFAADEIPTQDPPKANVTIGNRQLVVSPEEVKDATPYTEINVIYNPKYKDPAGAYFKDANGYLKIAKGCKITASGTYEEEIIGIGMLADDFAMIGITGGDAIVSASNDFDFDQEEDDYGLALAVVLQNYAATTCGNKLTIKDVKNEGKLGIAAGLVTIPNETDRIIFTTADISVDASGKNTIEGKGNDLIIQTVEADYGTAGGIFIDTKALKDSEQKSKAEEEEKKRQAEEEEKKRQAEEEEKKKQAQEKNNTPEEKEVVKLAAKTTNALKGDYDDSLVLNEATDSVVTAYDNSTIDTHGGNIIIDGVHANVDGQMPMPEQSQLEKLTDWTVLLFAGAVGAEVDRSVILTGGGDITISDVVSGFAGAVVNEANYGERFLGSARGLSLRNDSILDLTSQEENANRVGQLTIDGVKSTGEDAFAIGYELYNATDIHQGAVTIRDIVHELAEPEMATGADDMGKAFAIANIARSYNEDEAEIANAMNTSIQDTVTLMETAIASGLSASSKVNEVYKENVKGNCNECIASLDQELLEKLSENEIRARINSAISYVESAIKGVYTPSDETSGATGVVTVIIDGIKTHNLTKNTQTLVKYASDILSNTQASVEARIGGSSVVLDHVEDIDELAKKVREGVANSEEKASTAMKNVDTWNNRVDELREALDKVGSQDEFLQIAKDVKNLANEVDSKCQEAVKYLEEANKASEEVLKSSQDAAESSDIIADVTSNEAINGKRTVVSLGYKSKTAEVTKKDPSDPQKTITETIVVPDLENLSGDTIKLEGDILSVKRRCDIDASDTSEVYIALQNEDSFLKGNLVTSDPTATADAIDEGYYPCVGNIDLALVKGGTWYPDFTELEEFPPFTPPVKTVVTEEEKDDSVQAVAEEVHSASIKEKMQEFVENTKIEAESVYAEAQNEVQDANATGSLYGDEKEKTDKLEEATEKIDNVASEEGQAAAEAAEATSEVTKGGQANKKAAGLVVPRSTKVTLSEGGVIDLAYTDWNWKNVNGKPDVTYGARDFRIIDFSGEFVADGGSFIVNTDIKGDVESNRSDHIFFWNISDPNNKGLKIRVAYDPIMDNVTKPNVPVTVTTDDPIKIITFERKVRIQEAEVQQEVQNVESNVILADATGGSTSNDAPDNILVADSGGETDTPKPAQANETTSLELEGEEFTVSVGAKKYKTKATFTHVTSQLDDEEESEEGYWGLDSLTVTLLGLSSGAKTALSTRQGMALAFLATTNTLQHRLGDLRSGAGSNIGWARFERTNNYMEGTKMNGNQYQVGYDREVSSDDVSKRYFGVAIDQYDGNSSFETGNSDIKSTTLGVYYTRIFGSGHYYDFIFRYGRVYGDWSSFDADAAAIAGPITKSDFGVNTVSLSAEYGYRASIGKAGFYVEPQVEVLAGYISSSSDVANSGDLVYMDTVKHFITRLGLAIGQRSNALNYYFRFSYYHDFCGDLNIAYSGEPLSAQSAKNWYELTFGMGWLVKNRFYFYLELSKFYRDIANSLNFNLGFRVTL